MKVGVIGGGGGLAASLEAAGIEVVGCPAGGQAVDPGIEQVGQYRDFLDALDYPRRYVLDLPPGAAIDTVIDEAYQTMEPGDVVLDPTASYWGDTLRRYRRMRHRSLFYQDMARLNGPEGALLAVSGDAKGLTLTTDLLEAWSAPGELRAIAGAGFAHYLAVVQAAAIAARRQLEGEINQLVEAYPGEVDEADRAGFCVDLAPLDIARAGWLLDDAVRLEAAVPLLAHAVMQGICEALEAHESMPPLPRGAFVHPDDIL